MLKISRTIILNRITVNANIKQVIKTKIIKKILTIKTAFLYIAPIVVIVAAGCMVSKQGIYKANYPVAGKPWNLSLPGSAILDMVWIAPGTFIMGSPVTESGRKTDEGPQTEVKLTKGYWMGKTELTIGQWKAVTGESLRDHVVKMLNDETVHDFGGQKKKLREFMNFNPEDPGKIMANENDSLPMYFVSWDDAMEFCQKLNLRETASGQIPSGYEYSLPTEAQWEYACRSGTTTATYAGTFITRGKIAPVLDSIAWYAGNNSVNYQGKKLGNSGAGPRNAGDKKPNAWGLHDMPGNIWEWCRDWYGPYPGGMDTDPTGAGEGKARVNRGGSWGSGANDCRSGNRARNPQPEKSAYRGFRIALCAVQE
ncbi:MAG: formylglycine-generating enzyme family protein [Ferruginibacter sp.]